MEDESLGFYRRASVHFARFGLENVLRQLKSSIIIKTNRPPKTSFAGRYISHR